jgi:hypothetical protein
MNGASIVHGAPAAEITALKAEIVEEFCGEAGKNGRSSDEQSPLEASDR